MSEAKRKSVWSGVTPVTDYVAGLMEGGERLLTNEEFWQRFGRGYRNYRYAWRDGAASFADFEVEHSMQSFRERDRYVETFGFAIPNAELIALLREMQPLTEVGAGTGYLAALAEKRGIDIWPTDACAESHFDWRFGKWSPITPLPAKQAVRWKPERNVFCSWPSLKGTWLRQAAKAMRPGRFLVVIREDATADERTWAYVERFFEPKGHFEIPCFVGLHDAVEVWKKKGGPYHWSNGDGYDRD